MVPLSMLRQRLEGIWASASSNRRLAEVKKEERDENHNTLHTVCRNRNKRTGLLGREEAALSENASCLFVQLFRLASSPASQSHAVVALECLQAQKLSDYLPSRPLHIAVFLTNQHAV